MRKRSARRKRNGEDCNVCYDWLDYTKFREWSLNNGYTDGKVLCRNGDVGDYSPDNVRWDTQQSNAEEGIAKYYTMKDPDDKPTTIYNMRNFCKENNLQVSCMRSVYNGTQKAHKGWTKTE